MDILITICARGGSKGIPGKNIKLIAGKPLIAYTIETARKFALNRNCVIGLSTDAADIIDTAAAFGVKTNYKRPDELATDAAGKLAAIRDLLQYEEKLKGAKFDYVMDLDVTAPLRTVEDIESAIQTLQDHPAALNIFSVSPASKNPYFNMVERNSEGYYQLSKTGSFLTRQSSPAVYSINGSFYIFKRSFFDGDWTGGLTDRSLIYEMPHMCFDLDHTIDFEFMQFLLENNKLDFSL